MTNEKYSDGTFKFDTCRSINSVSAAWPWFFHEVVCASRPFPGNGINTAFTKTECADICFVYGHSKGSARAEFQEWRRRFPNREAPSSHVFIRVHKHLREIGSLHTSTSERSAQKATGEKENILHAVERIPKETRGRRNSRQTRKPPTQVWLTLCQMGLHPYHTQHV
jgi:hypothetical protein